MPPPPPPGNGEPTTPGEGSTWEPPRSTPPPPAGGWAAPPPPGAGATPTGSGWGTPPPPATPPAGGYTPPPAGFPGYGPPPVGAPSATNGLAIGALVCGILTFACLGPFAGVAAVVLGIFGLSKAKQIGTGRGMSIAGIILGAVGTALSILLFVLLVVAAEDATDGFSGTADPDHYDLTVDEGSCTVDGFGTLELSGTIENTTGSEKNFDIHAMVRDADTGTIIATSQSDLVTNIPAGQSAAWDITFFVRDDSATPECSVTVENWLN